MQDKKRSNYFTDTICNAFREVALSRNYRLQPPSASQKANHVDFVMLGQSKNKATISVTVDVKGFPPKSSDKWTWIELKNAKGRAGWVYQEADFIAFERRNDFLIVSRKKLVNWLNTTPKVKFDLPSVNKPWQAKYRLYSRPEKKEIITQILSQDLLDIPETQIWPKLKESS